MDVKRENMDYEKPVLEDLSRKTERAFGQCSEGSAAGDCLDGTSPTDSCGNGADPGMTVVEPPSLT